MTHCERVLELLSDRREHSHHELYALNVVAHSRVAELRKRGYEISQRRVTGADGEADYVYQLISSPSGGVDKTVVTSSAHAISGEGDAPPYAIAPRRLVRRPESPSDDEQLSFEVAA